ncbi:MAG: DUF1592 domain-containing protein [Verrucomicrobiales bacterium]|nr:DUF1592 domain-containing protein [Verrucomicrobiales bacterium]
MKYPLILLSAGASSLLQAEPPAAPASAASWSQVRPALEAACYDCHNDKKQKGDVDLSRLDQDPAFEAEFALWDKVREVVEEGSMPPEDADELLPTEKGGLLRWIDDSLTQLAAANAGDPGPVTLRRLTNLEYQNTLRELTQQNFDIAHDFMPDGGGGEGFSNIGDVLFVSPQQLDKYLAAARVVADHASILPGTGIWFQPGRVGRRSPKQLKDQAEQALYVWYQKAATPFIPKDGEDFREADYMLACWKWKYREQTGASSLEQLAEAAKLNLPFLENWWHLLTTPEPKSRFLDLTRLPWRDLPPPAADKPHEVPEAVTRILAGIQAQRRSWLGHPDPGSGVQRRQQDTDGLRPYTIKTAVQGQREIHLVVSDIGDGNAGDVVQFHGFTFKKDGKNQRYTDWLRRRQAELKKALAAQPQPALQKELAAIEAVLQRFKPGSKKDEPEVLPTQAPLVLNLPLPEKVTEFTAIGRLDLTNPEADQATAQWALYTGTPPNPSAIIPGVLTVWKRRTPAGGRTMSDFGVMKAAFPDVFERRLEQVADNLKRQGRPGVGVYYLSDAQLVSLLPASENRKLTSMQEDWTYLSPSKLNDKQWADYHQRLIQHLTAFAARAWRRPLTPDESKLVASRYRAGLAEKLDPESAGREVLVWLLVSPNFLYKAETLPAVAKDGTTRPAIIPLNAWQLASRLSYFLWASTPDWALRQAAADGSLLKPAVLQQQTLRMLKDPRSAALASAFAGQWLEFADFTEETRMDAAKFPEFTPELRSAFIRETQLFFENLIRQDRPVSDIVLADYSYLNEMLARHYQVPGVTGPEFRQVAIQGQPRGGLIGMGSILAKTSRPHRTSPVLRGNWLLNAVLGTPVPPPPNAVPELQEHPEKPRSLRQQFDQHREDPACAACHNRIDPLGFALEAFDPIGRVRQKDDLGMPIDSSASLPTGEKFDGFKGLRDYLGHHRHLFYRLFARKLLGYALGRETMLTDRPLLTEIEKGLGPKPQFSTAVLAIVASPQFRERRTD